MALSAAGFATTIQTAGTPFVFVDEGPNNNAPAQFSGNQTPPAPNVDGSLRLFTQDTVGRPFAFTFSWGDGIADVPLAGLKLADITALSFSNFTADSSGYGSNLNINVAVSGADTSWQGRLVLWEPGASQFTQNTWQTVDAINGTIDGNAAGLYWYFTRPASWAGEQCVQGNPALLTSACSLSSIIARYPNIMVNSNPTLGGIGWRTGGASIIQDIYVDNLTLAVSASSASLLAGTSTTYDFVPEPGTYALLTAGLGLLAWRKRKSS